MATKTNPLEALGLSKEQLTAVQAIVTEKETAIQTAETALKSEQEAHSETKEKLTAVQAIVTEKEMAVETAETALKAEQDAHATTTDQLEQLKAAAAENNVRINPTFTTKEGEFAITVEKFVFAKDGEAAIEYLAEEAVKDKTLCAQLLKIGAGFVQKVGK